LTVARCPTAPIASINWARVRELWVLDAADDLEKNGLFKAAPAEAVPTASGWHGLAAGAAIIGALGGLAWLARRAANAA
jgi:hypothetical protein